MNNPFRYFNSSPEVIRLVVMMYVRYPLSLRNVEDLLAERGIDISHETVRFWWNRFGPIFAAEIRSGFPPDADSASFVSTHPRFVLTAPRFCRRRISTVNEEGGRFKKTPNIRRMSGIVQPAAGPLLSGGGALIKGYFRRCAGRGCGHVLGLLCGE